MSKLAHSNEDTMDWIEFKSAIEDGNEDLVFQELQGLRKFKSEHLKNLREKAMSDCSLNGGGNSYGQNCEHNKTLN